MEPSRSPSSAEWMLPDLVPGLVSVIIPTYNRENLVVDAIRAARYLLEMRRNVRMLRRSRWREATAERLLEIYGKQRNPRE